MNGIKKQIVITLAALILLSLACYLPIIPQPSGETVETQSARTMEAMLTRSAADAATAVANGTLAPTRIAQLQTATTQPVVLYPTATTQVVATSWTPTNTSTPVCDQAAFVADITIPDGAQVSAGTPFMKTWRLRNSGACTWTADYAVVFTGGDRMSAPADQKLGMAVPPGQTVDISVPHAAPAQPGSYRGYWRMRNAAGVLFGIGPASERFYVDLKVPAVQTGPGFDFAANRCLAQWTGNGRAIACGGTDGAAEGFVLYQTRPVLETGSVDNEPALLTHPPSQRDSFLRGIFPAYNVRQGDRFLAVLSCEYNARNCNVRFQLDYQLSDGAIQNLASWHEVYEGGYTYASVDLSALAGKNVSFILTVLSNGASDQDRAIWLAPRIAPQTATATPTATPTITPTVTATQLVTITDTPTPTATTESYPYP